MNLPYSDSIAGADDQPPSTSAGEQLGITICYEDVFGAEQLHYLPEATLLVNVSNDGWFGDSIAIPHSTCRSRACARPRRGATCCARRTAASRPSSIRTARVVETIAAFRAGVLRATVRGYTGATPYARVGNYLVVVLGARRAGRGLRRGVACDRAP